MPSGNNWKKILLEIYNKSPHLYGSSSKMSFYNDNHPLAQKIKITGNELNLGVIFLMNNGLIKQTNPGTLKYTDQNWSNFLSITEKGFNVALELEKQKNSNSLKALIAILTAMLVLNGAFQIVTTLEGKYHYLLMYSFAFVVIFIIAWKIKNK